jgi:hypothetical protein
MSAQIRKPRKRDWRKYYYANREKIRQKRRESYWARHEQELVRRRTYNKANRARIRECNRKWAAANQARVQAHGRAYRRGERYSANREKRLTALRKYTLKKQFNVSAEEYDDMLARQNGVCAICEQPPNGRRLAVDHCHKTIAFAVCCALNATQRLAYLKTILTDSARR